MKLTIYATEQAARDTMQVGDLAWATDTARLVFKDSATTYTSKFADMEATLADLRDNP